MGLPIVIQVMNQQRLRLLFDKYLHKTCTQAEYNELLSIIYDVDDDTLNPLLDEVYELAPELKLDERSAGWMLHTILNKTEVETSRHRLNWPLLGGVAATVLVLITFGIVYFRSNQSTQQTAPHSVIARTKNDRQLLKFPDGSTVVLNKNSYVCYASNFEGRLREVTLVGEGYFDIKHNVNKPFVVRVGKLSVTVLGTAFNINSSPKNIEVTVTRGKVSVSDKQKTLGAILPNQQINYNTATSRAQTLLVNANSAIKWQANDLYFDDISLQQVTENLSKRFNKRVILANEQLKNCKMTAAFTHGESLPEILKIICEFNNTKYEESGDRILINGEGCQ